MLAGLFRSGLNAWSQHLASEVFNVLLFYTLNWTQVQAISAHVQVFVWKSVFVQFSYCVYSKTRLCTHWTFHVNNCMSVQLKYAVPKLYTCETAIVKELCHQWTQTFVFPQGNRWFCCCSQVFSYLLRLSICTCGCKHTINLWPINIIGVYIQKLWLSFAITMTPKC